MAYAPPKPRIASRRQRATSCTLAIALLAALPALAAPPHGDGAPPLSACDVSLAQQVAVQGLSSVWEHATSLSSPTIPSLGFATTDMASAIDATVGNYMNEYGLPGGAVALTYKGSLVFAKSYGYMDVANALFAEPDTRFRTASVSKAITAMGVLKLVHDGRVSLSDTPFPFGNVGTIIGGTPGNLFVPGTFNSELASITVDDLLHHAGGWDRNVAPDLTGYDVLQGLAAFRTARTGTPSGPPGCTGLLAYVESQPLQFTPGSETHYSNVGFCALSEVIRERGGSSYVGYLTANVLAPLGMHDTTLGATPETEVLDREATYYDLTDPPAASLFPPYATVPAPYSTIGALESLSGAGGLVSTAVDLARFAGAIASGKLPNLSGSGHPGWPVSYYALSSELPGYECSSAIPPYPPGAACPSGWSDAWEMGHWAFGAGWDTVYPNPVAVPLLAYDNFNFIKDGGYPGTVSSVAATADGYGFGAVFNANDNTVPSPQSQIFWPSCAGGTPPVPAASSDNCLLQAAYDHTAVAPWGIDFARQYSRSYTAWMSPPTFAAYLTAQKAKGVYPSRLEGQALTPSTYQYRGRFAPQPSGSAPKLLYGQSCATVLAAVQAASAATPLVSLQRFAAGGTYLYQAVWSARIPQLPGH